MKKVVIVSMTVVILGLAGFVTGYYFNYNYILKSKIEELELSLSRANENAQGWANKFVEQAEAGASDEWFEKNAKTRTGQPEDLLRMADDIGLKHIRKTNLAYADNLSFGTFEAAGTYNNGDYGDPDGRTIRISKDWDDTTKRTILAHEYLHYIWFNSAVLQNDFKLEQRLMHMYDNIPWLRDRLSQYRSNKIVSRTELFSYVCTEVSDGHMDEYVLQQCNKWLNRSKLVMHY